LIGVRISSPTAFLVGYRPQSFERSVGFYLIDHRADGIAERVARREAALRVQIPSEVVLPVSQRMQHVFSLVATISAVP